MDYEWQKRKDLVPRIVGVDDAIGIASGSAALLFKFHRILSILSDNSNKSCSRRVIVQMLLQRLELVDSTHGVSRSHHSLPAAVKTRLEQLNVTARKLEKRLSASSVRRMCFALLQGDFDKQIDILRTGLDDIDKALTSCCYTSGFQVVGAQSHSHGLTTQSSAPAPHTVLQVRTASSIHTARNFSHTLHCFFPLVLTKLIFIIFFTSKNTFSQEGCFLTNLKESDQYKRSFVTMSYSQSKKLHSK
jgi:hypothetical protein